MVRRSIAIHGSFWRSRQENSKAVETVFFRHSWKLSQESRAFDARSLVARFEEARAVPIQRYRCTIQQMIQANLQLLRKRKVCV